MKNIWRSAVFAWKEVFTWENALATVVLSIIASLVSHFTGYPGEIVIGAIGVGFAVLVLISIVIATLLHKFRDRT